MGYSLKHKGYKCLSNTGRIYISASVKFNEKEYPFQSDPSFKENFEFSHNSLSLVSPLGIFQSQQQCNESISHTVPKMSASKSNNPGTFVPTPATVTQQDFATMSHSNMILTPTKTPCNVEVTITPQCSETSYTQPYSQPPKEISHYTSPFLDTSSSTQEIVDIPHGLNEGAAISVDKSRHPMLTRAKTGYLPPPRKWSLLTEFVVREPTSTTEALSHPDWYKAMQVEYEALMRNQTWELVPPKLDQHLVSHKWVYKVKLNADGSI